MPFGRMREAIHQTLEVDDQGPAGRVVTLAIISMIVVNLTAVTLASVPVYYQSSPQLFTAIEILSVAVFSIEYVLRLWSAGAGAPGLGGRAALRFALSPSGLIDLAAILPYWLAYFVPADLRVLLVLRILRFFKLARYSPAMQALFDALYAERRALIGCIVILLGAALFSATAMHLAEGRVQPEKLGTIPDAMWWAIVTLGTVGYGDIVPVTALGKLIATLTILSGLIIMALPIGIIASALSQQVHRRDFVVTWTMLSRVPLFAGLRASEVGDIMKLLVARRVASGEIVARRGERAESMFFIVKGEVEVDLGERKLRMGAGHFFGEVALLRRSLRSANSVAMTEASLLVLQADDLHSLMQKNAHIRRVIEEVVRSRVGHEILAPRGDIIREELSETPREPF